MRTTLVALAFGAALATPVVASDVAVVLPPKQTIYLFGADDLARLQASNPSHYARAERILAASDRLCRPGPAGLQLAAAAAEDISCSANFLRTSYPPKVEIRFTLDDTRYVALVTLTADRPRVIPAR